MRGWMMLVLATAAPVVAQEPCAVPAGLAGFTKPLSMPRGRTPALPVGRAVTVPLSTNAKLAVEPDKAPEPGTRGGAFGFTVAKAGRYRVAVDQPLWIEVASRTIKYGSVAHGHAPACSGARKMVDYDLQPGFHLLQLSGGTNATAVVMVAAL